MGGKKKVTIGYRYYMGIHMGLCRGPVDQIVEIKVGDLTAWPLDGESPISHSTWFRINAGDLFGGDKGEGGVSGSAYLMMGEQDQIPAAPLVDMLRPAIVPGFRGTTTLFYDGLLCSMNPYPKPWKYRVRRWLKGWLNDTPWYPSKALIPLRSVHVSQDDEPDIYAMNPAHIIYESYTSTDWGRGIPAHRINEESFVSAANVLCDERFGLCIRWNRQETLASFVQSVLDVIGAGVYADDQGRISLKLFRKDYVDEDLPHFDYTSGLVSVSDLEVASGGTGLNEIIVKYRDPVKDEDRQVRVQNITALAQAGQVYTDTRYHVSIPTPELALRVAQRDLRSEAYGLRRMTCTFDRAASGLVTGMPIRISAPDRGIFNMVVRVGTLKESTSTDGKITTTVVQDVFGLPSTSYVQVQPPGWQRPTAEALPATHQSVQPAPYREIVQRLSDADMQVLSDDVEYVSMYAMRPTSLVVNYDLALAVNGAEPSVVGTGDWTPSGTLQSSIGPYDTTLRLAPGYWDLDEVAVGDSAQIGGEILRVDVIDFEAGIVTVGRGCADTIPTLHYAGDVVWFPESLQGYDETQRMVGTQIDARALSRTSSAVLSWGDAPSSYILSLPQRQALPYPPGNFKINGSGFADASMVSGDLSLSWSHRDRILQQDQLVDHNEGSIGPEPGTTYTLQFYDTSGTDPVMVREVVQEGTEYNYPSIQILQDWQASASSILSMRVVLFSSRDGLDSWQKYEIDFKYQADLTNGWSSSWGNAWGSPAGWGWPWGDNFGSTQ